MVNKTYFIFLAIALLLCTPAEAMHKRKNSSSSTSVLIEAPSKPSSPYETMSLQDLKTCKTELESTISRKLNTWDSEGYCCASRTCEVMAASVPGIFSAASLLAPLLLGEPNHYSTIAEVSGCDWETFCITHLALIFGTGVLLGKHISLSIAVTKDETEQLYQVLEAIENNPEQRKNVWREYRERKVYKMMHPVGGGD